MHALLCCLVLASHAAAQSTPATILRARVVAIASGTAFAVLDADEKLRRIKLTGVDAPERRQRFAPEASKLASEWLGANPIDIVVDAVGEDNRLHGRVRTDGRDVGLALIEAGLVWCDPHDEHHLPSAVRATYRQACNKATSGRQGLWQDAYPSPPWEYRKIPEFDPLPGAPKSSARSCRQIGYETLQCDDGASYRGIGAQVRGSDGTLYSRRGNMVTGSDGNRFEQQGTTVYGTDGSVCRTRGRRMDCY